MLSRVFDWIKQPGLIACGLFVYLGLFFFLVEGAATTPLRLVT